MTYLIDIFKNVELEIAINNSTSDVKGTKRVAKMRIISIIISATSKKDLIVNYFCIVRISSRHHNIDGTSSEEEH